MTIAEVMQTPLHFKVKGAARNLHPTCMPVWSLLKGMQENKPLADLTAQGREILRTSGKEAFKAWKPKNLMAVYFGCKYKDTTGRADEANVCGYTGLAGFDFDDVEAAPVLEKLREIPQVVCAGVSASGKGVWCAARVACATAQEYKLCFADGVKAFQAAGLPGIDIGAHDHTRARFAASSPESWWRWDADGDIPAFQPVGDLSLLGKPKKEKRGKIKLPADYPFSPELAFDEVRQVLATADETADGDRNTEKARQCGQLKAIAAKAGVSPAAYYQAFVDKWDEIGSTPKKTRSIANRLLLGGKKGTS